MSAFRVATFNLLHGVSLADGRTDAGRLRDAAARLDADVAALQEVDKDQPRSGGVDQTAEVAAALGAVAHRFAPALHGTPGESGLRPATAQDEPDEPDDPDEPGNEQSSAGPAYGVGMVSRHRVLGWHERRFTGAPVGLPLLVPGRRGLTRVPDEPRAALAAVLDAPGRPLSVVTAHLSFVPGWNVAQLRALLRWARELPRPLLLIGDFNLPGPLPAAITGFTSLARVATYPSYRPRVQFDHVLADGLDADAVRAVTALQLPVSDHCALVVDLDL